MPHLHRNYFSKYKKNCLIVKRLEIIITGYIKKSNNPAGEELPMGDLRLQSATF
jgi:hypothetical protein